MYSTKEFSSHMRRQTHYVMLVNSMQMSSQVPRNTFLVDLHVGCQIIDLVTLFFHCSKNNVTLAGVEFPDIKVRPHYGRQRHSVDVSIDICRVECNPNEVDFFSEGWSL
uniref:Uncharacterized protein n=1 Tax=Cacopsylla melanoneura TaxID=428564 RepID=A0A8D8VEH5_9HEMI